MQPLISLHRNGVNMERTFEDIILEAQEAETDDCKNCPHKNHCRSQCMDITVIYNPILNGWRK